MFAINHAATALLLKRRYPRVPIAALLLSVQALELLWVVFNFLGLERTTTEAQVHSVSEIHLASISYSHSLASTLVLCAAAAALGWLVTRRRDAAVALALGVASHFALDLVTHAADLPLAPGVGHPLLGLGLYAMAPMGAFVLETLFGVFCWWVYRGSRALLVTVLLFNVANLSLFSAALRGPEELLAGHPLAIVAMVGAQIVVTLVLVGIHSEPRRASPSLGAPPRMAARS
jgi:membrane-bound metal-dependent hydrolase YbcI (DUF457 family)